MQVGRTAAAAPCYVRAVPEAAPCVLTSGLNLQLQYEQMAMPNSKQPQPPCSCLALQVLAVKEVFQTSFISCLQWYVCSYDMSCLQE